MLFSKVTDFIIEITIEQNIWLVYLEKLWENHFLTFSSSKSKKKKIQNLEIEKRMAT